jgi:DNA-binding transcriptional LysR family regulator
MNLRQLRYVVATADHGTMTAAAQALYVAQPALSRAIRELERELGLELFSRSGRGVVLTETGMHVVRYAREALRAVDAIEELTVSGPNGRTVELRIAALAVLEGELTGRLVTEFARDRGDVRVRVVGCDSRQAVAVAVREGRADLGVVDLPGPADLAVHPYGQREVARSNGGPILVTIGLVHARKPLTPIVRDFLAFVKAVRPHGT